MTLTDFERDLLDACVRPLETLELIQSIDCPNPDLLRDTLNTLRLRRLLDVVFITADILTEWGHDGFAVYRTTEKGCIAVSNHGDTFP